MILYPLTAPIILTDVIYEEYGGVFDTTNHVQRQAAYLIAEKEVSNSLDTLLLPMNVTGTHSYRPSLVLDYAYVNHLNGVQFLDSENDVYWSKYETNSTYFALRDDTYGIVDLLYLSGYCNCHTMGQYPYHVNVLYNAGLPTGTATQADFLLALTTYATIIINEIIGFGNEAPGDIGVQEFRNQEYWEKRVYLHKTAFGSSPKAHFVNRLLSKYKKRRWVGI